MKKKKQEQWRAKDVYEILSNPIYAGVGPFPDAPLPGAIPQLIEDNTWIEAQKRLIDEEGVRKHLATIRRMLHRTIGMKVISISHSKWLDESVRAIESDGAETFFRSFLAQLRPEDKFVDVVQNIVHIANITPELVRALSSNPDELFKLTPDLFEELICDRLSQMGFNVSRVGSHTYQKDGGVDIIACPKSAKFPFLMAVQAKHHRSPKQKTVVQPVRELLGAVQTLPLHAGVLVTNTTFTPDARWVAEQNSTLLRLRDIEDIRRWLIGDYLIEYDWREIPDEIEVCPGIIVQIPKA
jgi:HJR/Mrr/RecB family endonuclease